MNEIKVVEMKSKNAAAPLPPYLNGTEASRLQSFHESFPMYTPTPLASMDGLAKALGVSKVFVKDESYRFGLNAFKVLGGSYAIGRYLAERLDLDISALPYEKMISEEVRQALGELTFVSATDGNHGRGVAWAANQLGQKSYIYMPKGSAVERLENIRAEGADASIIEGNYDDAVRLASQMADEHGWILMQDTAWEGYEDIPTWIMQGYSTMGGEVHKQLGDEMPTHVFLQAGVGSMAGAIAGLFANIYGDKRPTVVVVEPQKADCLFRTASADDGKMHIVTGAMDTIMAGLACGEPCSIAWNILKDFADYFIATPDFVAAKGMRMLAAPPKGDPPVVSGESGAGPFGCVAEILKNPAYASLKAQLNIDEHSKLLFFNTEGDTDKEQYEAIVWDGKYPSGS